jgi:hypothetical protein
MPAGRGYKKRAPAKKTYKKRAPAKKTYKPTDGTTMLISSYFEVTHKQSANGEASKIAYTVKADPRNGLVTIANPAVASGAVGTAVENGSSQALIASGASSASLPFSRFATFAPLYGQYKINSINLSVDVDRECGLDNKVCFRTDKALATNIADMADVMGSAHKDQTMTETRRTAKYGWKPSGQDRDWRNMSQQLADNDAHYLKVFQEVEPKADGVCKHRVNVLVSVSLKDTQSNPITLN